MTDDPAPTASAASRRRFLAPLALAQFICSFAGSNMNVMINDISEDLDTTVTGVQTAITLFLLIMAIFMIPASKLSDRWGRKRCFTAGLLLYGLGALVSALSPGLGVLILGNSVLEGIGTALLIPPVYILTTMAFTDLTSRAKAFGIVSGMGGLGAAAGPLIGGLITTGISWRAAFVFQAVVVAAIIFLSRRMEDPLPADPTRPFDTVGAILSAVGMFFVVFGILQADNEPALDGGFAGCRSRLPALVLPPHPRSGASGEGTPAVHGAVQEPPVQSRPCHTEHPVAASHGDVIRRRRLPADGSRVQRHRDGRHLHLGDGRHPRGVAWPRSGSPRGAARRP